MGGNFNETLQLHLQNFNVFISVNFPHFLSSFLDLRKFDHISFEKNRFSSEDDGYFFGATFFWRSSFDSNRNACSNTPTVY